MNDLITVENGTALMDQAVARQIAACEETIIEVKQIEEELKGAILAEMEAKGIIKIDNEFFTLSYVASTDREVLDSKLLREELPDVYDAYTDMKPVKASIRIKLK